MRLSTASAPGAQTMTSSRRLRATTQCCCSRCWSFQETIILADAPFSASCACRQQHHAKVGCKGKLGSGVWLHILPRARTNSRKSYPMLWCAKWRGWCRFVLVPAHLMQRWRFGACGAQVAGLLLKKYKERFATAPVAATYRYLRQWAADSLPANPLVRPGCCFLHLDAACRDADMAM